MKLVKTRRFTALVTVGFPASAEAKSEDISFTAHFVALSKSELKEFDLTSDVSVEAFLRRVLVGWEGIVDDTEGGVAHPLLFRPETVSLLLDDLAITRALLKAYIEAMAGLIRGN